MSAADILLSRLENVKSAGPDKWVARCPAHEDRNPSLSVRQAEDRVLVYCWAGCGASDVVASVGLSLGDLFDERRAHYIGPKKPPLPTTRELLAIIEYDLAVVECLLADLLCGVPVTKEGRETATGSLESIRTVLEVCHANG